MINRIRQWIARSKVDLSYVDPRFLRKTYRNVDWTKEDFSNFVPVGCRFENCNFEGVNFSKVCFGEGLEDTEYINCNFNKTKIFARAAGNAKFDSCSFKETNIIEFFAFCVEMTNCVISGVLRKAVFNGKVPDDSVIPLNRTRNKFEGNDFSQAKLVDVAFRTGIDLSLQRLPEGWCNEA